MVKSLRESQQGGNMSTEPWRDAVLTLDATLATALRSLDLTALQIVLVLDVDGRLLGTLTDGDVRRALLRGETLQDPISGHMKTSPITIAVGTRPQVALEILRRMGIRSAPVVDSYGRVVDLVTLNELISPSERKTPAVIMAGGRGSRLRPLTDNTPKPLVSINGEPLIDITTRRLVSHGFRRIWVTTHYKSEDIQSHLGDGAHLGADIRYIPEPEPLGTAGAVREVPVECVDTPILVCNSDNLHTIDFGALLDYHTSSGAIATLAVTQHVTEVPYGVVTIENGQVGDLIEKPRRSEWVATGVSVLTGRALGFFPERKHLDVPTVISELLDRSLRVGAFQCPGYWSDVGNPDELERVRSEHRS